MKLQYEIIRKEKVNATMEAVHYLIIDDETGTKYLNFVSFPLGVSDEKIEAVAQDLMVSIEDASKLPPVVEPEKMYLESEVIAILKENKVLPVDTIVKKVTEIIPSKIATAEAVKP